MSDAILFLCSVFAGALGALVGIGGGIIIVPLLTVGMGLGIQGAVGISLIAVVATSVSASVPHLRSGLANLRLGTVLELPAAVGAIIGYSLSRTLDEKLIALIFGVVLMLTALLSIVSRSEDFKATVAHRWSTVLHLNPLASRMKMDESTASETEYNVARVPFGMFAMIGAGTLSALLGIGAGVFKVLALDRIMRVPFRPSSATSSLMMGTTASVGAIAYFASGQVRLDLVTPVVLGIMLGARYGAKLLAPLPIAITRTLFWLVLLIAAARMMMKGMGL